MAPCLLARRLSPLIAACRSLASVGKAMAFGCTVVSTNAPATCATRRLSASSRSSLSPSRLRQ